MPVEFQIRLCIPYDGDRIVQFQVADLWLVEVRVHLQLGEIRQLQNLSAGLDIGILSHGQGKDSPGEGSVHIRLLDHLGCGGAGCLRFFHARLRTRKLDRCERLLLLLLKRVEGSLRNL